MSKMYRIKELSKLTSVTPRTLHYYDEIDLLKPSHKTCSRHRLYSENDLCRLQQITTLKFMGFSLDQIFNIISKPGFDIKESLRTQAKIMSEEAIRMDNISKLLRRVVDQIDTDESINGKSIAKLIEAMQEDEEHKCRWRQKYLVSPAEQELFPYRYIAREVSLSH